MRELDRERAKMEQQEKKIIADIKKMAKQGTYTHTKFFFVNILNIYIEKNVLFIRKFYVI